MGTAVDRRHAEGDVADRPLDDVRRGGLRLIRPSHVEAWVKSMTVPTAARQRPLAPGTIKTRFVNVRSVFRAAVRDGMIAVDPTVQVRLPRLRRREAAMAIPSPEVVRRILDAAAPRFRAFVGMCALAGLRLGETAAHLFAEVAGSGEGTVRAEQA